MSETQDARTIAIVSYLTIIGWVIALLMHQNNKSELGAFHLRQTLGLYLTGLIISFLYYIPFIGWILSLALFVFWVIGLVNAAQGEQKPIPLVGEFYQSLFRGIN